MSEATEKLVAAFSAALLDKLNASEQKHGFDDDWLKDDWEQRCQSDLASHVQKGDPLDVAAYAAFCWYRGWKTSPQSEVKYARKYPCVPTPFATMHGNVMMCKTCGHYQPKECQ